MSAFFSQIAQTLGYKNNIKRYTGASFKAANAVQAVESLNVSAGDIVVFYYTTQKFGQLINSNLLTVHKHFPT